jgi:HEXXH motif-containing protein
MYSVGCPTTSVDVRRRPVVEYHRLDPADAAALASGLGGAAVVRQLRDAQLSRNLLLLKYVCQEWSADRGSLDAAVGVLAEAQRVQPQVFADLMSDPLVSAWLAKTTRRLRDPATTTAELAADLLHIGGLAASAAVSVGLECEVTGHTRRGRLTLPGLGEVLLTGEPDGSVPLRISDSMLMSPAAALVSPLREGGDGWLELRRLTADHDALSSTVTVEDGNPYRDGYHAAPSGRLTSVEVDAWQRLFAGAWELIGCCLPERASELAVGLRCLVPLVDDGRGAARSGTAWDSVGAVGLTRPRSAADFAVTLVHEFQHSKLSSALDLVTLYVPDGPERHAAPWRTDPRPTSGLIQGVYAFLGVADTWRALRAAPGLEELATRQFAVTREQVRRGLDALEGSAELTSAGRAFAAGMRSSLDSLLAQRLPPAVVERTAPVVQQQQAARSSAPR